MRALPAPLASSAAIADVVSGPQRDAVVIHRSAPAAYLRLPDGRIVAAEAPAGIGLPISMTLADLTGVDLGATVVVGGASPGRWWSGEVGPVEPLPGPVGRLAEHLDRLRPPLDPFEVAVAGIDPLVDPASLVGLGPGLTPAGDDLLAGLVVTLLATGRSDRAGSIIDSIDPTRTTPISAAILAEACAGRAARPLLALLRSLGRYDADDAPLEGLLAVGATSGRWLATGVLGAVRQL